MYSRVGQTHLAKQITVVLLNLKLVHSQLLSVSRVLSTAVTWVSHKRRGCALRRWGGGRALFSFPRRRNKHCTLSFVFELMSISFLLYFWLSWVTQRGKQTIGRATERKDLTVKLSQGFILTLYTGGGGRTVSHNTLTSFTTAGRRNSSNSTFFLCAKSFTLLIKSKKKAVRFLLFDILCISAQFSMD